MKLLYITNGITGSGGLERVLSIKTSMLAEEFGYEVHILVLNESTTVKPFFDFSEKIKRHTISVSGNPLQYCLKYRAGIRAKVSEINPDVISVCDDGLKGFFIPRILRKEIPIIYERHVSKLIEIAKNQSSTKRIQTWVKFGLMNFLAKDFKKFVVLTNGNKDEWKTPNLSVIPNPLPFFPEETSDLMSKKVIAVGKQSYQKAYDLLLESWRYTDRKDWTLRIYGKEDPNLKLAQLAQKLGVSDSVFFHPPEKNILKKYQESSIFVLSSRFEGFGMVIIEAMSCGLPVVSFNCPFGPSDIILDNEDGFLVENGNTKSFAEKLSKLINDKDLQKKMGTHARLSSENYKPEEILKTWDTLFKELKK